MRSPSTASAVSRDELHRIPGERLPRRRGQREPGTVIGARSPGIREAWSPAMGVSRPHATSIIGASRRSSSDGPEHLGRDWPSLARRAEWRSTVGSDRCRLSTACGSMTARRRRVIALGRQSACAVAPDGAETLSPQKAISPSTIVAITVMARISSGVAPPVTSPLRIVTSPSVPGARCPRRVSSPSAYAASTVTARRPCSAVSS